LSYKTEEKDNVHIIKLPPVVEATDATQFESMVKTWLLSSCAVHVLDLSDVRQLKSSVYRSLVLFNQQLRAHSKRLFALGMNAAVAGQVKNDGLTDVFYPVQSIDEAKRRGLPSKTTVDVEFINPFITATKTVLETQANLKLTPGKAYLRKPTENIPMEIAGVLNLVCSEFKGSISLCFRGQVFLNIYESMVGEKHAQITSEIQDAAGELLNIIFGQAKTVLNDQKGYSLEKSLPTILVGEKLKLHHQSRSPAIILPFDCSAGTFHVEIVVDRSA
jgi:chemotaxis protein CheX